MSAEKLRLQEDLERKRHWRRWGPYLSERQWGTVREDYDSRGDVWFSFTHDMARSRAYRWGEDGIGGLSDNHQQLCFAFTFWNGVDPILKERLFGLAGPEGNHGEDVKEYYFHLDNTPTHSYMHYLYKYPQGVFPYEELVQKNGARGLNEGEFELLDTQAFTQNRYYDIAIEYAKSGPEDVFIRVTAANRGPEAKKLHILPTLWFRKQKKIKPNLSVKGHFLEAVHSDLGRYFFYYPTPNDILFTDNETNTQKLYGTPNQTPYVKDAFHDYLIHGKKETVNPKKVGTKAAPVYVVDIPAQKSATLVFRLCKEEGLLAPLDKADEYFAMRKQEADAFYAELLAPCSSDELKRVQRRALDGLLWNKQFYHYVVDDWLKAEKRPQQRNADWNHLYNEDILSLPDKWEYPFFSSWDTAFHTLGLAMVDPEFAKRQLILLTREWYMHPNGQIPAYEWNFSDVNPPVHAWAAWRIFKIEQKMHNKTDHHFLERVFQKLLLNFTWWVNRKDSEGKNVFQGGFLGLDNISLFNRSEQLPQGGTLYQSDATSWMGMYCLNMLTIALELAKTNPSYEDMASKFFEHFLYIADAINYSQNNRLPLWNDEDSFYYDVFSTQGGQQFPLKVRSIVGVIPLFAIMTLETEQLERFSGFRKRLEWFLKQRNDLCEKTASMRLPGEENRRLLAIVQRDRLKSLLTRVLDEKEFLSPYGIRSLSKFHQEHPFVLRLDSTEYVIGYEPAESRTKMFGGNSNWRGPVWFPLNMLIIESLQKFHHYFGDDFKVECPTGSGQMMNLWQVAGEIANRLTRLFLPDASGKRPIYGANEIFQRDPHWKDHILFYEYFHADNGMGLGASHQTGWTGLVAKLIQQLSIYTT